MGHMKNLFNGEEEVKKEVEDRELPGRRGQMDTHGMAMVVGSMDTHKKCGPRPESRQGTKSRKCIDFRLSKYRSLCFVSYVLLFLHLHLGC